MASKAQQVKYKPEGLNETQSVTVEINNNGVRVAYIHMVTPVQDREVIKQALRRLDFLHVWTQANENPAAHVRADFNFGVDAKRPKYNPAVKLRVRNRNTPPTLSTSYDKEIDYLWTTEGASKIFRTEEDFKMWLERPNVGLQGQIPINFLKTDIDAVSSLIIRLLHGVLA